MLCGCVVPDIWCYYLEGKFCCVWPHFHQTKEIKSRTQPKKEWASFYADKRNKTFGNSIQIDFRCVKIILEYFVMSYSNLLLGSYNEAKAKEITATQRSDLSSEPEDLGRGKRVRRMTRSTIFSWNRLQSRLIVVGRRRCFTTDGKWVASCPILIAGRPINGPFR